MTPSILICDDEPEIRQILATYLTDLGYQVTLAADGRQCLEMVEKSSPDAIILDLNMPNLDGVSVVEILREHGQDMPILVISALHDVGAELEVTELGLGIFVPKPFSLEEISGLLQAALLERADATGQSVELPALG